MPSNYYSSAFRSRFRSVPIERNVQGADTHFRLPLPRFGREEALASTFTADLAGLDTICVSLLKQLCCVTMLT